MDPDDDAMYTLITMIKTAVQLGLSGGGIPLVGTKQERQNGSRVGQQTVCASQAAQTMCVKALVSGWSFSFFILRLSPASSPPILSLSLSLFLPSDVLGDTSTHGTHKDRAGLSERRDSGVIISDNYSRDSIVHKSDCCPCFGAFVRRRRCFRGGWDVCGD